MALAGLLSLNDSRRSHEAAGHTRAGGGSRTRGVARGGLDGDREDGRAHRVVRGVRHGLPHRRRSHPDRPPCSPGQGGALRGRHPPRPRRHGRRVRARRGARRTLPVLFEARLHRVRRRAGRRREALGAPRWASAATRGTRPCPRAPRRPAIGDVGTRGQGPVRRRPLRRVHGRHRRRDVRRSRPERASRAPRHAPLGRPRPRPQQSRCAGHRHQGDLAR